MQVQMNSRLLWLDITPSVLMSQVNPFGLLQKTIALNLLLLRYLISSMCLFATFSGFVVTQFAFAVQEASS